MAWEWQQQHLTQSKLSNAPQFLLLDEDNQPTATSNLYRFLERSPRPFDLWLVNFAASTLLKDRTMASEGCPLEPDVRSRVSGYRANYYHCQAKPFNGSKSSDR